MDVLQTTTDLNVLIIVWRHRVAMHMGHVIHLPCALVMWDMLPRSVPNALAITMERTAQLSVIPQLPVLVMVGAHHRAHAIVLLATQEATAPAVMQIIMVQIAKSIVPR
jgi:hypothetical protein